MANAATMVRAAQPGRTTTTTQAAPVVTQPFTRAAHQRIEPATDNSYTMTANQSLIGPLDVPSFGWLRDLIFYVTCTTASNAATVVFKEDAPFSVLAEVVLNDVNGGPLTGPISGFELYVVSKFGGYDFDCDPTRSVIYSLTAGVGAGLGGSFAFMYKLPVEITERDALGSLANQNAAGTYKLRISAAASTDVYSTAPTTLGTVRIRTYMETWTPPNGQDFRGNANATMPPAEGTTQYWSKQVVNIAAAAQTVRFTKVGNLLRNLILIFRDTTPVRSTANFPADFQLIWDGLTLMNIQRDIWRALEQERYGLAAASMDAGIIPFDYTHDFDGHPGGEQRDLYVPTTQATNLVLQGTFGTAGTLTVLTNDVAPGGRNNPIAGSS